MGNVGGSGTKIEASAIGVIGAPFVTTMLRFTGRRDDPNGRHLPEAP
jgi:hypothetical protein